MMRVVDWLCLLPVTFAQWRARRRFRQECAQRGHRFVERDTEALIALDVVAQRQRCRCRQSWSLRHFSRAELEAL